MKLFILSDLHGSVSAFEAAMGAFAREGADYLVLAGDYLNHGPRNPLPTGYAPAELAKKLNARKEIIIGVRGNCDSEVDQMLLEFPMMSESATLLVGGKRCYLCHGHLYGPEHLPPLCPGDILISGHTHVPMLVVRDGVICLNPGSPSLPKGGSLPGYAVIDEDGASLCAMDGTVLKSI